MMAGAAVAEGDGVATPVGAAVAEGVEEAGGGGVTVAARVAVAVTVGAADTVGDAVAVGGGEANGTGDGDDASKGDAAARGAAVGGAVAAAVGVGVLASDAVGLGAVEVARCAVAVACAGIVLGTFVAGVAAAAWEARPPRVVATMSAMRRDAAARWKPDAKGWGRAVSAHRSKRVIHLSVTHSDRRPYPSQN